ncbi:MAG: hypothetical protein HY606_12015 [Planctomycetes bacterium]|nr:hypothetical protein [Planctomycetota bacterium]
MGTLTKVFIVINFIFAIVMFAVQTVLFSQREDWKSRWIDESNNHLKTITIKDSEIQYWLRENRSKDSFITDLKTNLQRIEREMQTKDAATQELQTRFNQLQATYAGLQSSYDALYRELESIRSERENLQRELTQATSQFKEIVSRHDTKQQDLLFLQTKFEQISKELDSTEVRLQRIVKEKKELQMILDQLQQSGIIVDILPTKSIKAKVQQYNSQYKIATLSAGKDQNVRIGDRFSISRGEKFIASGKVTEVEKDFCFMKIEYTNISQEPAIGDDANNKIITPGTYKNEEIQK